MYRIILALLFVFSSISTIFAQQLQTEKVGDITQFTLLIPYASLHPNVKTLICEYEVNIDILDAKKNNQFHLVDDIRLVKPDSMETEVYPFFFRKSLVSGKYTLYLKLYNPDLGDKHEQKFEFTVPPEGKKISAIHLVGSIQDAAFLLRDTNQISPNLNSLRLRGLLSMQPDSVRLLITDGAKDRQYPIETGQLIDTEISGFLNGYNDPTIKLQVFSGRIKYTKEVRYHGSSDSFNSRYSLEDQVLQLRYVMNQNELNYIRNVKPEKYKQVIDDFWRVKDPTPDTKRNEYRELFESRVLESDNAYSIRNYKPGWKTDRGKIFIKYGSPDEVAADAYPINKPPYIIWYYYSENKIFQFFDFDGWGNYQLGSVSDE